MKFNPARMTRDQIGVLLYLETCMVDQQGRCQSMRMNDADFKAIEKFKAGGLLDFGRIAFKEIPRGSATTHWVTFTDAAWTLVHLLRRQRADRNYRGKHHEAIQRRVFA